MWASHLSAQGWEVSLTLGDIIALLSLFVAILGLSWVANRINKIILTKYERQIRIVVCGATSAGKTDLWIAWRDSAAPRSDSGPTVGSQTSITDPLPYGKFTLIPAITDIAGTEPWLLARKLRGDGKLSYSKSSRIKRILVFVVAPCRQNTVQPGENSYDQNYIAEQKGYAYLPMAIIAGDDTLARPDMVIMFISKFDLISRVSPQDTNGVGAREYTEKVFWEHRRLIEAACGRRSTLFTCIVGSAKEGWGIRELRDKVREVVNDV